MPTPCGRSRKKVHAAASVTATIWTIIETSSHAVRIRKPVIEDAVFGFRAAGPALLSNMSYFEQAGLQVGSEEHEDEGVTQATMLANDNIQIALIGAGGMGQGDAELARPAPGCQAGCGVPISTTAGSRIRRRCSATSIVHHARLSRDPCAQGHRRRDYRHARPLARRSRSTP